MRIAMCDDEKKFLIELEGLIAKSYPDTDKLYISE